MKILDYDDVHPIQVLQLNMLALDFPFTPEHAAHLRRTDPRAFPDITLHAIEDNLVIGQVGLFRLPAISTEGREDVGGVWAVATHPHHTGREVTSALLEEAHARMRDAGLRFSTLTTDRYRQAHQLYRQHGYVDMNVWAAALARWETAHQPTRLRAQPPGQEGFDFIETLFEMIAKDYLGFAWRHTPFACLRDKVYLSDIWVLWENNKPVGYVFGHKNNAILHITVQALHPSIDTAEAIAAVASTLKTSYIQVVVSRPAEIASLRRAGYQVTHPNRSAFLLKPLVPEVTAEDARKLFGIGTDRFLISWLDTTCDKK